MPVVVKEDDAGTKARAKKALKKLKDDIDSGAVISKELNRVWRRIRDDAVAMCPKKTGTLARTIRIVRIPMGGMTGGWSRIKQITMFDRSIVAGDITKTHPKSGRPIDYASWVHDGHKMKDGRFYAGVPFLSESLAKHSRELEKAIDRALRKLAKKYSKGGR